MTDVDVKKLLNPVGAAVQEAVKGARNEGRVAVAVHWSAIEEALDSGLTIAAVHRVLSKAGLVAISVRTFQRQVLARREGPKSSGAAKPEARPRALAATAVRDGAADQGTFAPAGPDDLQPAEKRSGIPHRPWRTGPRKAPDPNLLFRPRDPLAD